MQTAAIVCKKKQASLLPLGGTPHHMSSVLFSLAFSCCSPGHYTVLYDQEVPWAFLAVCFRFLC